MTPTSINGDAMNEMRGFVIEAFVLLGLVVGITGLRLCLRTYTAGVKHLRLDDGLVAVGMGFYICKTVIAYMLETKVHWLANHSISEAHRAVLQPSDHEYQLRELGSKLYLYDWVSYSAVLWALKAAFCAHLLRQSHGSERRQRLCAYLGFCFIFLSWLAVTLTLLQSCPPLGKMWQIYPDPGPYCQPANSPALVWTYFSLDMMTNIYLAAITLPLLFRRAGRSMSEALWSLAPLGCGLFVMAASVSRAVLLVSGRVDATQGAALWTLWQVFAALVIVNAPVFFSCFRDMFSSNADSLSQSSGHSGSNMPSIWRSKSQTSYQSSRFSVADTYYTKSEERILSKEANIDSESGIVDTQTGSSGERRHSGIQRMIEVTVVEECFTRPQRGHCGTCGNYTRSWSNEDVAKPEQRSEFFEGHVHHHSQNSNSHDHRRNSR